jgi:hypothetical protein
MRISKASFELAHLITPRHARNALDLGTGCGFLATLLSPQADRVYALDLNSAAIQFAEFNARWNSFRNITCLQGNLFGPVREIRFDHIVCNPPFLICPVPDSAANEILFLHSGQQGDSFCFQIVRESASFLEEGGILNMMFSWIQTEGQEWHARPNRAFSGLGCDAWCLRTSEESPEDYVSSWLALLPDQGNLDVDTLRRQGLEFFQQQKIGAVGTGFLTLRKYTSRANHLWFDDAPDDRSEPFGSSVAKVFDLRAKFDSVPEEIILQQKFEVAPDTANIQKSVRKGRRWEAIASELCRESGLKYTFSGVDPILLEIVMRLDGKTSLREILARLSRERRLPLSRLIANRLPSLRELLRFGFILPATAGPPSSKQRRSAK